MATIQEIEDSRFFEYIDKTIDLYEQASRARVTIAVPVGIAHATIFFRNKIVVIMQASDEMLEDYVTCVYRTLRDQLPLTVELQVRGLSASTSRDAGCIDNAEPM